MTASLILECVRRQWRITWIIDGDEGATLGDTVYTDRNLAKAKPEDWDHIAVTLAASKTEAVEHDSFGYYWESESDAKKAYRVVKSTLKNKGKKPWPEWATKAVANGWKPPARWNP